MSFFDSGHAVLKWLDPEVAHQAAIFAMRMGIHPRLSGEGPKALQVPLWGMTFPNPVGMAAGFDKDAMVPGALLNSGFGFVEVGTLTPKPQPGAPKPRIFPLPNDRAIINRMGFCNNGYEAALELLRQGGVSGILGVNLGANKESRCRVTDYVSGIRTFSGVAAYFTINVSSPNTPGLRDLQKHEALSELLSAVLQERDATGSRTPVLLKISPDLNRDELDDIMDTLSRFRVDGLIVSNTTVSRPESLSDRQLAREEGGLSGVPLFELSTSLLARIYRMSEGKIPLVGVGGIHDAKTAYAKICAGASLIQLYSALVYEGYGLLEKIRRGLVTQLRMDGFDRLQDAVGSRSEEWNARWESRS